jgi:hypothetical protein
MKKLLALVLITGSVWAEPTTIKKEVVCDSAEVVFKALSSADYQEKPVWLGAGTENERLINYSLWVNTSAKTWTIVQFNNKIACILGTGEAYTISGARSPV